MNHTQVLITDEDIEEFYESIKKAFDESIANSNNSFRTPIIDPICFVSDGINWHIAPKECDHKWAKYTGFTEKYEFCEHCDVKRN